MQRKIMISLVLVFALTAQSTARDAKADLEKRKAQLEQEKALLLKEMQNYAGAFLGGGEKIVKGLQEFTINMVGGVNTATGVGFSTVEVTHQIIKAREAGQKGDINGYNSAVRSVIVEVLKEAITKIKYKDIGEFLDWAMKAYSGGDAGKATLENIKTRRNLEKGKDQTIKRLGEVNQELLSVNQQLTNLPRIPAATREQLKANNGKIQEEQKKVA